MVMVCLTIPIRSSLTMHSSRLAVNGLSNSFVPVHGSTIDGSVSESFAAKLIIVGFGNSLEYQNCSVLLGRFYCFDH